MPKLVFDIETSGLPVESFDAVQQEYLFRDVAKIASEEGRAERRCEIIRMLNLWPLTARIVCIAMVNVDSARGRVLFTAEDCDEVSENGAPVQFVPCVDESELLTQFWDAAKHYEGVITFNGRGFDVPFLYLRSALLNIAISRKDWLGYRFQTDPHCDLAEQLFQPGFLLQGVWHPIAQKPRRDRHGCERSDRARPLSRNRRVLLA